jgi:hypothetical protein
VQLADAQSAGEVVRPHRGAEDAGQAARQQPVAREDGEQEGKHAYQVRRGGAQYLSFGQCFVDEADFPLLEIPDAAVYELRRLRRRARREIALVDERGA